MVGLVSQNGNLRQSTNAFINELLQGNPHLRQQSSYQNIRLDGRQGLVTTLAGQSPVFGQTEIVEVYTVPVQGGGIAYFVGVSPQRDYRLYQRTFNEVMNSVNLNY
jgi:hypothetical protein